MEQTVTAAALHRGRTQKEQRQNTEDMTWDMHVHANEVQVFPHPLEQLVQVPLQVRRDGHVVRDLVDHVQFWQRSEHHVHENE